ncbi:hypothetical protein D9758_018251 [Tetrapyrgos nigripes]|uniref:Chitin synthase export chaperone n=1 Tax=Tetrapyrgos nigripes TaxID=182062 RepID=A0A8H5BUQ4_9AGAR|nr:hypothetical protein D9758_018251 [Tetrapyrgos nigripes]
MVQPSLIWLPASRRNLFTVVTTDVVYLGAVPPAPSRPLQPARYRRYQKPSSATYLRKRLPVSPSLRTSRHPIPTTSQKCPNSATLNPSAPMYPHIHVGLNPKCGIPKVSADLGSLGAFLQSSSSSSSNGNGFGFSNAYPSINWGSGSSLGNIANILACGLSILVILAVLYFVQKRKAAVGRVEMRLLFLVYGLTLVFQILTTTSLLTQGTTALTVLTSIHAGLIPAFFTILFFNAFVSTQIVDDGTLKSLAPMSLVSLLFFVATTYISLDTGLAFTNGFAPNSGDVGDIVRLNNPALFVLTSIWPLLCALGYFVLMTYIVLRMLGEYKPFALFLGSAVLFVLSQAAWFLLGRVVCQHTNGKLDSSFIATVLETASVVVLFWAWRSITEGGIGWFLGVWGVFSREGKHGTMRGLITSMLPHATPRHSKTVTENVHCPLSHDRRGFRDVDVHIDVDGREAGVVVPVHADADADVDVDVDVHAVPATDVPTIHNASCAYYHTSPFPISISHALRPTLTPPTTGPFPSVTVFGYSLHVSVSVFVDDVEYSVLVKGCTRRIGTGLDNKFSSNSTSAFSDKILPNQPTNQPRSAHELVAGGRGTKMRRTDPVVGLDRLGWALSNILAMGTRALSIYHDTYTWLRLLKMQNVAAARNGFLRHCYDVTD